MSGAWRVGQKVVLQRDSWFLSERHGAVAGSTGVIVRHSRLSQDDDGVLVDWGDGQEVRSNRDELLLAEPYFALVTRSIASCAHCTWTSESSKTAKDAATIAFLHIQSAHGISS